MPVKACLTMDIRITGNQDTAQLFLQLSRILYKSALFFKKQSQFGNTENECKLLLQKGL